MKARRFLLAAVFATALGIVNDTSAQQNVAVRRTDARVSEKRVALVIGNNAYRNTPLTAPINDARDMSIALTNLGFKVTKLEDVGRLAMLRAMRNFVDELSGSSSVGLFYFAGHGAQSKGKNFLIPVDADIQDEDEVELQGVDLQYMLDKFAEMRNSMNILILDACRDNPFTRRPGRQASGLSAIDGPPGTLVAFAAAPGQVAGETSGANGIYTKHVLANISTPGLPVEEVFKRIRLGVLAETKQAQVPWENTSLVSDFYFRGAPAGSGYRPSANDSEAEAWSNLESSRNIYDFVAFMRRFPKNRYQSQILGRINLVLAQMKPAPPSIQPNELKEFLNEGYAGFTVMPLNKYLAEYYGLMEPKGVIVVDVDRGSIAERAGLLPTDILLEVNGKPVIGAEDTADLTRTILPGEFVEGVVWRNRREVSVSGLIQRAPLESVLRRIGAAHVREKSYDRAHAFYQYLAAIDDPWGETNLGLFYLAGLGIQRDFAVAESWLLKAALQGKPLAAAYLSSIYLNPNSGIRKDAEAFRWAKYSAEGGVPLGATLLSAVYLRGIGTARNQDEGWRWARLAAEQGEPTGQFLLGSIYEDGTGGVPRNLDDAKKWYRRARDLGSSPARAALQRLGE